MEERIRKIKESEREPYIGNEIRISNKDKRWYWNDLTNNNFNDSKSEDINETMTIKGDRIHTKKTN